jgi:hypothetical protein
MLNRMVGVVTTTAPARARAFYGEVQDELGIWTAPNGDRVAWFKDPGGNTLSISCLQSRL